MGIIISGFSDEISDELDKQIEVVKSLGMNHISIRGVDGKNIADYTYEEFCEKIYPRLVSNGIELSSIGSPIGKIFIDDEAGYKQQLIALEELCKMANKMQCKYIRMFSFFIDKEENYDDYKDQVLEKLRRFVDVAKKYDVMLLHENEKDIYGDIARRCVTLLKEIDSPYFRAIFDFANFVQCNQDTLEAYEGLEAYIEYIHIKDANYSAPYNVLCGTGDGKLEEILADLIGNGYEGFLTLEPHLALFGSLKDIELEEAGMVINLSEVMTGEEGYEKQYKALIGMLDSIGAKN